MQTGERVNELVRAMTLAEKCSLTTGDGWWRTQAVPRVGIPAAGLTDAPNGARGPFLAGEGTHTSTCVPSATALGATWDPALIEEVGALVAEEARSKGARILLAPMVNLHRSPLAGRNLEGFSEDPLLSGAAGAAYVRGAQSRGVACTVKHLVANEAEFERGSISSEVDERTLRELYLTPFEMTVREGGALGIMTAYNRVNGTWCAEHEELLAIPREEWGFHGFVVSDWGGVGSSAGSLRAGLDLEMPGPGTYFGPRLLEAVERGEVKESDVDVAVTRLLTVLDAVGALDEPPAPPASVDRPAHRALARRAAAGGMVLLRNDGLLPLRADELTSIAVIGPNAESFTMMGGGSATFHPHYRVSPLEAIRAGFPQAAVRYEPGADNEGWLPLIPMTFTVGVFRDAADPEPLAELVFGHTQAVFPTEVPGTGRGPFHLRGRGRFRVDDAGTYTFSLLEGSATRVVVDGVVLLDSAVTPPGPGPTVWAPEPLLADVELAAGEHELLVTSSGAPGDNAAHATAGFTVGMRHAVRTDALERAVATAASADVAVVLVGSDSSWETEAVDRPHMDLRGRQDELVERVLQANPRTVVVLNTCSPVTMPWVERAPALLQTWFGGQEMSRALVDVLTGDADPGGRLPTTFPRRIQDTPAFGSFPGESGVCRYGEGVFMGYRWYTSRDVPVLFPFGYGLSYTTFELGEPTLSAREAAAGADLDLQVRLRVTNTGGRPGSEVVQCYVEPPGGSHLRPVRELRAFRKVELAPGQSTDVELSLGFRSFARWIPRVPGLARVSEQLRTVHGPGVPPPTGPAEGHWHVDPGSYRICIGRSVTDLPWSVPFAITQLPGAL